MKVIMFLIIRYAFLCNLLTEMMRPRFDDPVDTSKDMVEKNITLFTIFYQHQPLKKFLESLNIPEYTYLAKYIESVENMDEYYDYVKYKVHGNGTHGFLLTNLLHRHLQVAPMDKWWKSSERMPGITPYVGYNTGRNWILKEVGAFSICYLTQLKFNIIKEFALLLLRFQQVKTFVNHFHD